MGQSYYSVWIDSLFLSEQAEKLDNWADRGLSPYAFSYVVVSPGLDECEADLKRMWLLCEHQLAEAARGVLMHVSDEKPSWAHTKKKHTAKSYINCRGGSLTPRFALCGLAVAISAGLIEKSQVSYTEDRNTPEHWSTIVLLSKWPGTFTDMIERDTSEDLPGPIGIQASERLGRVESFLRNIGNFALGTMRISTEWDVQCAK